MTYSAKGADGGGGVGTSNGTRGGGGSGANGGSNGGQLDNIQFRIDLSRVPTTMKTMVVALGVEDQSLSFEDVGSVYCRLVDAAGETASKVRPCGV